MPKSSGKKSEMKKKNTPQEMCESILLKDDIQ